MKKRYKSHPSISGSTEFGLLFSNFVAMTTLLVFQDSVALVLLITKMRIINPVHVMCY